ncbi:hypothetical protein O1611_g798 [Lasiodiplodia mahajangana]|uniref:Uncharacterized protein n=1 Tax=Lasiodiplodia mahajangana TaxID=1108764 RepID=A0ACC2JZU7_9PEZI|nr:hypothetical protein O1611_g798 [Lasiodiplodia mahajangana]
MAGLGCRKRARTGDHPLSDSNNSNKKSRLNTQVNFPPEFWDRLSKVPLTGRALRELDRRNGIRSPLPPRVQEGAFCGSLAEFARRGGPNIADLRGAFKRTNANTAAEDDVVVEIVPVICGTNAILSKRNPLFTELKPITDGTASQPKPDVFDGARFDDIDKRIRTDEHIYPLIIPTKHLHLPVAPNFFLEVKSQSGDPAVLERQACYDGAHGARAMHCLQNYGREKPIYDGNAYAFSATYHPGSRTLSLYAHHITAPATSRGEPEYHLTDLPGYYLMSDRDALVAGLTAFRNLRDVAQEFRDNFIKSANAHARNDIAGKMNSPIKKRGSG